MVNSRPPTASTTRASGEYRWRAPVPVTRLREPRAGCTPPIDGGSHAQAAVTATSGLAVLAASIAAANGKAEQSEQWRQQVRTSAWHREARRAVANGVSRGSGSRFQILPAMLTSSCAVLRGAGGEAPTDNQMQCLACGSKRWRGVHGLQLESSVGPFDVYPETFGDFNGLPGARLAGNRCRGGSASVCRTLFSCKSSFVAPIASGVSCEVPAETSGCVAASFNSCVVCGRGRRMRRLLLLRGNRR